ncbi:FkbM family methyltransferase [Thiolapillus brandeum]|uniref:FkbM family methyltransferase n=1 Tax=Thiolapillus brandeum TaxID=1076588 RepID=UPI001CB780E4|nr:FkbM family methyltransferase [Thiolapillus brandeum]
MDAGAHIGMSAVFFASKYPKARVIAIEPEPTNYQVLHRNAQEYTNISTIQAGLWSRKAHLCIEDSNVDTWSFRVVEDPSGKGIPAIGIQDVMSEYGVEQIDVLKMDIEGAEVEVLNNASPWFDGVKNLFIELHDRFRPGCTAALRGVLEGRKYDESESGESVVIRNFRVCSMFED